MCACVCSTPRVRVRRGPQGKETVDALRGVCICFPLPLCVCMRVWPVTGIQEVQVRICSERGGLRCCTP
jgi:hypothetical protein